MPVDPRLRATVDVLVRAFGSNAAVEARRMADRLCNRNGGYGDIWWKVHVVPWEVQARQAVHNTRGPPIHHLQRRFRGILRGVGGRAFGSMGEPGRRMRS